MGKNAVFDIRKITKVYRTGDVAVHALRGASARLYEGEISVMLGPSGSGKSTFLNIVGGLDKATDGQVMFDGTDITNATDGELTSFRRRRFPLVVKYVPIKSRSHRLKSMQPKLGPKRKKRPQKSPHAAPAGRAPRRGSRASRTTTTSGSR